MPVRRIIEIDENRCDGCGLCVLDCAENAIAIIDGKARVRADHFCDGLGACLAACPQNALRVIEREAAPFDAAAVRAAAQAPRRVPLPTLSRGCPGAAPEAASGGWPVKLRLAPPFMPCPAGNALLLAADCAPAASPGFHAILAGRRLLTACPKFEDHEALAARLADILSANPGAELSFLRMEVPCCRGLRAVCGEAMRLAGRDGAASERIMGRDGLLRDALMDRR